MPRRKTLAEVHVDQLPCAAAALAHGVPLICTQPHPRDKARLTFVFSDPRAAEIVGAYMTGTLTVNAKTYQRFFDMLRDLARGRCTVEEVQR
jgi:hypothetical protein